MNFSTQILTLLIIAVAARALVINGRGETPYIRSSASGLTVGAEPDSREDGDRWRAAVALELVF